MRIVLVHGMGRTPLSMMGLAGDLRSAGHQPELVAYLSALDRFDQVRDRVRRRLERLARAGAPYAVIGHSLGGLALRAALEGVSPQPVRFIMLGTPNRVPRLAVRFRRWWPYRLLTGQLGQLLAQPEFFTALPAPAAPYTIIAGTAGPRGRWSPFGQEPNDWIVAVAETRIADDDRPIELPAHHAFMMGNARVRHAVRAALNEAAA